ncbi:hypothetical protein DPMN_118533 [Dreissena polymorpha]|uniref:Uncharacterized protein n=1 Tax=Dreissena polymorpha TaxID=45954 RepID=A0A9D4GNA1_DREPO|nr:hypothetical protein DPMN_118533 [Dreissena polymorpha]
MTTSYYYHDRHLRDKEKSAHVLRAAPESETKKVKTEIYEKSAHVHRAAPEKILEKSAHVLRAAPETATEKILEKSAHVLRAAPEKILEKSAYVLRAAPEKILEKSAHRFLTAPETAPEKLRAAPKSEANNRVLMYSERLLKSAHGYIRNTFLSVNNGINVNKHNKLL